MMLVPELDVIDPGLVPLLVQGCTKIEHMPPKQQSKEQMPSERSNHRQDRDHSY